MKIVPLGYILLIEISETNIEIWAWIKDKISMKIMYAIIIHSLTTPSLKLRHGSVITSHIKRLV